MKRGFLILMFCLMLSNAMAQTNDISSIFIQAYESLLSHNYVDAIDKYNSIYNKLSSKEDQVIVSQHLSSAYISIGNYKEAETILLAAKASAISDSEKSSPYYREIVTSLGVLYYSLNNFRKASEYLEEAKNLYEKSRDYEDGYVRCISSLSVVQIELGNPTLGRLLIDMAIRQARLNYERHRDGNNEDADRHYSSEYAQCLSNAAVAYEKLGYTGNSVSLLKEAINVYDSIGEQSAYCYASLGHIYYSKSNVRDAVYYYEKALSIADTPKSFDDISMLLSLVKMVANDNDTAEITLKNSEILKSHQQYAFTFLSEAERQNYWEESSYHISLENYIYKHYGNEHYNGAIYDNLIYSKGLLLRTSTEIYDKIVKSGDAHLVSLYRLLLQTKTSILKESNQSVVRELQHRSDSLEKVFVNFYDQHHGQSTEITWKNIQARLKNTDIAIEFFSVPNIVISDNDFIVDGDIYCAATIKKKDIRFIRHFE